MDVANSKHRLKNAMFALSLAHENLENLTKADTDATKRQAHKDARDAWRRLSAAHHEFVESILERLGR